MADASLPTGQLRGLTARETLGAYRRLVGVRLRSDMQYRTSFALSFIVAFLLTGLDFVVILLLFRTVDSLASWTLPEIAVLYGIAGMAFSIADLVVGATGTLSERIRSGTFDQLLIRPIGPLWQMSADEFYLRRFGRLAQTATILIIGLSRVDVDWTIAKIGVVVFAIPTGAVIFGAVFVAASTVSFWFVSANEAASAFTYGGQTIAQYPMDVFAGWLRRFALFVVPVAAVAYLPALFVLDVPNVMNLPTVIQLGGPVIALVAALLARQLWRIALRHHRSTGT